MYASIVKRAMTVDYRNKSTLKLIIHFIHANECFPLLAILAPMVRTNSLPMRLLALEYGAGRFSEQCQMSIMHELTFQ